jgi:hypothetical protein
MRFFSLRTIFVVCVIISLILLCAPLTSEVSPVFDSSGKLIGETTFFGLIPIISVHRAGPHQWISFSWVMLGMACFYAVLITAIFYVPIAMGSAVYWSIDKKRPKRISKLRRKPSASPPDA